MNNQEIFIFRILFNRNIHWVLNNGHKKTAWVRKCCASSFAKKQRATQFSLETISFELKLNNLLVHVPDAGAFPATNAILLWKLTKCLEDTSTKS